MEYFEYDNAGERLMYFAEEKRFVWDTNDSLTPVGDDELAMIRDDIYKILDQNPAEAAGVLRALERGDVDGQMYTGECSCLIGTIAKVRGCRLSAGGFGLQTTEPDSYRPAEVWFMGIQPRNEVLCNRCAADPPEDDDCTHYDISEHPVAAQAAAWIREWIAAHPTASDAS